MLATLKTALIGQYESALATFEKCIGACPEQDWDQPVCDYTFRHVAYHTLFFTDLYLCGNKHRFKAQEFHLENPGLFAGYVELEFAEQSVADRGSIQKYLSHCHQLAVRTVHAETEDSLRSAAEFSWLDISRAENHIYNIRHIYHHAAQLSLKLRLNHDTEIPWIKTGWN